MTLQQTRSPVTTLAIPLAERLIEANAAETASVASAAAAATPEITELVLQAYADSRDIIDPRNASTSLTACSWRYLGTSMEGSVRPSDDDVRSRVDCSLAPMATDPLAELAARLELQPLNGQYVHGYRADNWLARSNMGIEGTLFSSEILTLENPEGFASIRDVPIEGLRTWTAVPPLALLPRAQSLVQAHNIRLACECDRPLADLGLSTEAAERVTRLADYELAFEELRRTCAPDAPSRLSCIYLADDTVAGRNDASQMATMEGFVLTVRVPLAIRWARVDARWLGSSLDVPPDERITGYWSGEPMLEGETVWEWLVDGVLRCVDAEEFLRVREGSMPVSVM